MNKNSEIVRNLIKTLLSVKNEEDMANFLKDLCTPQEILALAERWHVCQLLHQGKLTYREINVETGVSLATITRVARFLKDEPNQGYKKVLNRISRNKK